MLERMSDTTTEILNLLHSKRTTDKKWKTHVSMVNPKGAFTLGRLNTETFMDYFSNLSMSERGRLGIAEVPGDFLPVLADIDLKKEQCEVMASVQNHNDPGVKRYLYSTEELLSVVSIYQSILRETVECDESRLICLVLEKPWYSEVRGDTTYVKNGFHLHFPFLFLSRVDINVHILPRVRERISMEIPDWPTTAIDECTIKNVWLLYGCTKNGDPNRSYKITQAWDGRGEPIALEEAFANSEIPDENEDFRPVDTARLDWFLPRIMSINPKGRTVTRVKMTIQIPRISLENTRVARLSQGSCTMNTEISPQEAIKQASELIPMLSVDRSRNYEDWLKVGWVLFNISGGHGDAFDLWDNFSKRTPDKYDGVMVSDIWNNRMEQREKPGMGTLIFWAQRDNPALYKEYKEKRTKHKCMQSIQDGGAHVDIAKMLFDTLQTEFKCGSITHKDWYQFREHVWEPIEEGVFLRKKISSTGKNGILGIYENQIKENQTALNQEEDKCKAEEYKTRIKLLRKITANLKSAPFKNNVMREAAEQFYDRNFKVRLNQSPNLVAFNNGVYDLDTHYFRPGMPEDYLSKKMSIPYIEYTHDSEEVIDVKTFLEQIFPDSQVRKYFLNMYCDIFYGKNTEKAVYFWTGNGDNGKSVTQGLFEEMLGPLAQKFETTLLTGKKTNQGAAAPEMARAAPPVRHAVLDEPNKDERINCGKMKQLSGSDTYYARDLYMKGAETREIKPMFTMTIICNELPVLKQADQAVWNRVKVIPFESKFVENAPDTWEEQVKEKRFPMVKKFNCQKLLSPLAWYLLEHRKIPKTNWVPDKVKACNEQYARANDRIRAFADEKIRHVAKKSLHKDYLYQVFCEWFTSEGLCKRDIPTKACVVAYFSEQWSKPNRGGFFADKEIILVNTRPQTTEKQTPSPTPSDTPSAKGNEVSYEQPHGNDPIHSMM